MIRRDALLRATTFDPYVAGWLEERSRDSDADDLSVEGMRRHARLANRLARSRLRTPEHPETEQPLWLPGPAGSIPARLLRPSGGDRCPLVVYFHGGGWVAGGLDTHAHHVRRISVRANVCVLSIDYRLAPEHPFPAAFDDCMATVRWAFGHTSELGCDQTRIAVAGDSAGAQLAASVAIGCRNEGLPLTAAALVVPVIDLQGGYRAHLDQDAYRSRTENSQGNGLTTEAMATFVKLYGVDPTAPDWRGSPWHADDLTGVAPTVLYTAGFDVLRDEGIAYAARLRAASVPVRHCNFPTLNHGFLGLMGVSPTADAASLQLCRDLAAYLDGQHAPQAQ